MNDNIHYYIKNYETDLSKTDILVKNYIISNWNQKLVGKKISKDLDIAPSSVSKFISKMKFKSIHELNFLKTCSEKDLIIYLTTKKSEILEELIMLNSADKFTSIIEHMNASDLVLTYGIGHSYLCAKNFKQRFSKLGYNILLLKERYDLTLNINTIFKSNPYAIIFSDSASTEEIIIFAKFCNDNNIKYTLVTSNLMSKLVKGAHQTLTYKQLHIGYLLETIGPEQPAISLIDLLYLKAINSNYSDKYDDFVTSEYRL